MISNLHDLQKQNPGPDRILRCRSNHPIHSDHIRHTKDIGASGALVSRYFNAESKFGSVSDYERYTRPVLTNVS